MATYEEWYKQWEQSPYKDEWSQADLDLAKLHPEFGMATLSNKEAWHNATTKEQKALANSDQEQNRLYWGGYTGGTNGYGQSYSATQLAQNAAREAVNGMGDFAWDRDADYQAALNAVINRDPFSYDYASDPVYQSYAKQYTREGRRASEDTMGQYAAMTGGRPSTAAVTASQQAGNYYASQLADKIPELYNQAYQRYLNEFSQQLQGLDALRQDYSRQYGAYTDKYGRLLDAYNLAANENATSRAAVQDAEKTAYDRDQEAKKTAYQQELDRWQMQNTDRANARTEAEFRAKYGQYDQLAQMLGKTPDEIAAMFEAPTVTYNGGNGGNGGTTDSYDMFAIADAIKKAGLTNETQIRYWLQQQYPDMTDKDAKQYASDYLSGFYEAEKSPQYTNAMMLAELQANGISTVNAAINFLMDKYGIGTRKEAKEVAESLLGEVEETRAGAQDGVANSGSTHSDGSLKSKGFDDVQGMVESWYKVKKNAKGVVDDIKKMLKNALSQKKIHEYEIDIILDDLGL